MKPQEELIKICNELGLNINKLTKSEWEKISMYQLLSEQFIERNKTRLDSYYISKCQVLSEPFIEKNKKWLNRYNISTHQELSEGFIEKNKDWLDRYSISICQTLSEPFIEQNKEWLDMSIISKYKKLSESFIERNKEWLYMINVVKYQKLSDSFIEKNKLKVDKNSNTLYWNTTQKIELLKRKGWKIDKDGYVKAWKGVKKERTIADDRRITYNVGEIYTAHCDCNLYAENSFGLSAGTYEKAKEYCDELVIKIRFKPEWLGAITPEGKLRLHKLEVLS